MKGLDEPSGRRLISVITVTKNAAVDLKKTLESLQAQTFRDFEFIVVNGNPEDVDTVKFLRDNEPFTARSLSGNDKGIYDAMNKGLLRARGDYVYFLNAGDTLVRPDTLEKVAGEILRKRGKVDVFYGNRVVSWGRGKPVLQKPPGFRGNYLLGREPFFHQAIFVRRKLHEQYLFDTRFALSGDLELSLRLLSLPGLKLKRINIPVVRFRAEGLSVKHRILSRVESLYAQSAFYRAKFGRPFPVEKAFFYRSLREILLEEEGVPLPPGRSHSILDRVRGLRGKFLRILRR